MLQILNEITYGNPTNRQRDKIKEVGLVDDLFSELKQFPYPKNNSDTTKQELNSLVKKVRDLTSKGNEKSLKRYVFHDRNVFQSIVNNIKSDDVDIVELIQDINKDISPLILKLKYYYQRPRPFQLANYYKLGLYPLDSRTANTASYPSGHTIQAYVVLHIIAELIPEEKEKCMKLIDDIAQSREYMGLHFPSDNDFGKMVGKKILSHPKFIEKYTITENEDENIESEDLDEILDEQ
jgi:hypothetical protein